MDKEVIEAFERMAIDWRAREVHAAEIDLIRAYLTDPGYRRVPVEPTDAMCEAGVVEALRHIVPLRSTITAGQVYKAMLSASQGEGG